MLDGVVIDDAKVLNIKLREWEDYYNYHRPRGGLGGQTPIPVLHNVTFADVNEYSSFLGDLVGFDTVEDSIDEIAAKIASALINPAS